MPHSVLFTDHSGLQSQKTAYYASHGVHLSGRPEIFLAFPVSFRMLPASSTSRVFRSIATISAEDMSF